jgi:Flp pilus assembly protein TadD
MADGGPERVGALLHAAIAVHRAGDLSVAEAGYLAVLALDPDQADALHLLGLVLHQRRSGKEAFGYVRRAIALQPDVASFHHSLGRILRGAGQYRQAVRSFVRTLRLAPGNCSAETDLAATLCDMKRFSEAEALLENALARAPQDADLRCAYGRLLLMTGRNEQAVAVLHAILEDVPNHVGTLNNLGVAFNLAGNDVAAGLVLERALALSSNHVDAHTNYGQLLLLRGDYAAGWAHHEWRLQRRDYRRRFAVPMWQGQPLVGQAILIWCEQGLGDAIHFIRYAPMVAARGGRVLVECRKPLHRLLTGVDGVAAVFDMGEARDYAVHVPVMSLPHVFGTTLDTIPAAVPYVPVPRPSRIDGRGARLKVGLVWAGNPDNLRDRVRSRRLADFAPLAALKDVAWYSLQVGAGAGDTPPDGMAIVNRMPEVKDFYDTAADLAALDLLITIDSSSAHLAGAIGAPVWVLLDKVADWRWLTNRDDTPWYPTMRLFRRDGDWPTLFARVAAALQHFGAGR